MGNKVNKKETINLFQERLAENNIVVSKKDTEIIMDSIFNMISDEVAKGNSVSINGFGVFKPKEIKGRNGTLAFGENIGQSWESESKIVLGFKRSSTMIF